jgi:hypothetical protein
MSGGTNTSVSKIVTVLVLVPLVAILWFAAPLILPVYRWQNIDFAALAKQYNIPESELRTEFTMMVYYHPRVPNDKDPSPYQIVQCTPTWKSVNPEHIEESVPPLAVRCTVISERDGEPISKVWIGVTGEERFFKIKCWRLPPGALGKNSKRPVLVYQGLSLEKVDINTGMPLKEQVINWENDDHWRDRDDGIGP